MFCADYVAAFVYHCALSAGVFKALEYRDSKVKDATAQQVQPSATALAATWAALCIGLHDNRLNPNADVHHSSAIERFGTPMIAGCLAGMAASCSLYPFDFVRGGVLKAASFKRIVSAGSTVPYAGTLFGLYFTCRDPDSIGSQIKWAAAASSAAVMAETPFDYAKRAMLGSTRMMLGAGLLYVPFATTMLVMYDKFVIKIVTGGAAWDRGPVASPASAASRASAASAASPAPASPAVLVETDYDAI